MQLLIQNKGVAPEEAFTLLGASLSRDNDSLIGQFGSGAKLAITALMRKGLKVTVYCGLTRMEFKTKDIVIRDGLEDKQQRQVYVQYGGTSTRKQDLSWVIGMGAVDWDNEAMAIREFVTNVIDRTVKQGDEVLAAYEKGDLAVKIVTDNAKRAQEGYTRVFIEANEACEKFVDELPRRFLHFSGVDLTQKIFPKLGDRAKSQIYYNGVFVRELTESADSLCDYNFTGNEIQIDESRNLSEYAVRAAIGRLYRTCDLKDLTRLFSALAKGTACLETGLDAYYVKPNFSDPTDDQKETWRAAWKQVNGDAVLCGKDESMEAAIVINKGLEIGVINESNMLDAAKAYGIQTADDVLTEDELAGRAITAPPLEAIQAVDDIWEWVTAANLGTKEKPGVFGFNETTPRTRSFNKGGVVYLRNDLEADGLYETALKEVSAYAADAAAFSPSHTDFLIKMMVRSQQ